MVSTTSGATTYTKTTSITSGTSYSFKVYGINTYGNGVDSTSVTILAASAPAAIAAISTTDSGSNVVFSWSATSDTRGSAVTSYIIKFKSSGGSYSTYLTSCDGSDAAIFAAR
jgi:hypothetical protein